MRRRDWPDMALAAGLEAPVAGVDEVGRGPLAGPLVAGAVVLAPGALPEGVADSKTLTPRMRERVDALIRERALVGLGVVEPGEIDRLGLSAANDLAMLRAIAALPARPASVIVDGRRLPAGLPCAGRAVIGGDRLVAAVAAASIVAKVARDRRMVALDAAHPAYGWARNKGYPTPEHRAALAEHGVTPQHRRSFAPVAARLATPAR
ncbi:MAG: ribonuclease HII [Paracoccaceae bacterium]